jgi:diacylglycerol O-acyltransferase
VASYRYEILSPQDAAFLAAEGPTTPMHIGAAFVAEAGPLATADGGIDIGRVREFIGARLHRIPRYRQRVAYTPLRRRPIWIDDRHFKVEFHVRHTALPRPGDAAQLKRLIGRVCAQPLDRARPLWELWVVEGLEEGRRFALISKAHHCMVDGVSSTELLTLLMSARPDETTEPGPPFVPRPEPSAAELARDELARFVLGPIAAAESLRELFTAERRSELGQAVRAAAQLAARSLVPASHTPLNREIGPHRRFETLALDLALVKAIKDKLGGTLNDVVLAAVSGAVRRFLQRRLVDVASLDFRISAPVSVRTSSEPDPLRRLDAIRVATRRLKESNQALGADLLSAVTEWTGTTLLSLGTAFQNVGRPQNLIVTNVPGPQLRLYLVGAPLVEAYPIGPLFLNQALIVALFSYDGRLFFGLNADAESMPDLAALRGDLERAFDELAALAAL